MLDIHDDFVLSESSSVDGTERYPDPANIRIQQCAGCQWGWNPTSPGSDPVLYKGTTSQGMHFGYPNSDCPYIAAMLSSWDTHWQGLYSFAVQHYAGALHHCESQAEVFTSDGSLMQSERTYPKHIGSGPKTINMSELPSGKYMLRVSTLPDELANRETISRGFVVVR